MDVKAEEENDPTTNVALPLPPEETVAVAAMAVAAPDEELPVPEAVKAMETITETLSEKPKEEGKETIANEGNDKTADAVAEDVADKSKQDVKMEEAQSVEAAAAEAGLTVVTTNDTNMSSAPPLENPGIASTEESPYPYQVNAGKDVISGKGGKVSYDMNTDLRFPTSLISTILYRSSNTIATSAILLQSHTRHMTPPRAKSPSAVLGWPFIQKSSKREGGS